MGGAGNDTLTGGSGADRFIFRSPTDGVDRITDFTVGQDKIVFVASEFGLDFPTSSSGRYQTIAEEQFHVVGAGAADASARIFYNSGTGGVLFDADGTGPLARVQIATLSPGLAMTSADILVTNSGTVF